MASADRLQVVLNHLKYGPVKIQTKKTAANRYIYTVDNNILSDEQRAFYEENGYIVIRKLVDDELLEECRQRFIDIITRKVDPGNFMILMKEKSLMNTNAKGEYLYNKIQDILRDEVFFKYITCPKILKYIECFTGPDITAIHSMLINKPPHSGKLASIHPLHQDLHYFSFRPAERFVASWTAMEKITVENGCLFVIPGTHKAALQPHDYPEFDVNKAFHGVKGFDLVPRFNLEMEKGDTVFFHPLIMHGSGPNLTKGFRKAISCHYVSSNCYCIDVKGTTQEKIAEELEAMWKRRGMPLTYLDIMKKRARVVQGVQGAFQ